MNAARLDRLLGIGPVSWLELTSNTAPTKVSVGRASAKASRVPVSLFEAKLMYARLSWLARPAGREPVRRERWQQTAQLC